MNMEVVHSDQGMVGSSDPLRIPHPTDGHPYHVLGSAGEAAHAVYQGIQG